MRIISANPLNEVTSIDLALVPAYRLCLVHTPEYLGIGLKYLAGAGANSAIFSNLMLFGILVQGLPRDDTTLAGIAKVGFQGRDLAKDRELIHDACRMLRNVSNKEAYVEEIGTKAEELAEFYWWFRPFIAETPPKTERVWGEWSITLMP